MVRASGYMPFLYPYYMRWRVAALGLHRMLGGVVFHKLGVINIGPECPLDRFNVWAEAVAANLRSVDDPLDARVKWLQTAANIFDLIYKGEGGIEIKSAVATRSPRPEER